MGVGARHVREWSSDFSLSAMWVRDFLLLLDIFASMDKIVMAYFGKQLFSH